MDHRDAVELLLTRDEIRQAIDDLNNGTFVWREGRG